jgi:hypothetical protein
VVSMLVLDVLGRLGGGRTHGMRPW